MKQKFTIKVADIELNIISEGNPEDIDAAVAQVDTCIRGICSKSQSVTKTEAAILCALDFCSQCLLAEQNDTQTDSQVEKLTDDFAKANATIAKLEAKIETMKEKADKANADFKERLDAAAQTQKEKYEGRIDNMKEKYEARLAQLKNKIDELKAGGAVETAQMSLDIPAEKPAEKVEDAVIVDEIKTCEPAAPEKTEVKPADDEKAAKAKGKNKVGSMFELLTFGDV